MLVEFPYTGWPLGLESAIHDLGAAGLTAAAGAPRAEQDGPGAAGAARARDRRGGPRPGHGVLGGRAGRTAARTAARRLLELGFVHVVASDAHHPAVREAGLAAAVAAIGDPELAAHLVQEVPAAIVAGASIPALPRLRRRPRLASFFGSK